MGRAKEHAELMLTAEDYRYLFDFIRSKRREGFHVIYGCSHYLGLEYEREVRDWYFMCNAGISVASIRSNGDIVACLDIEPRPEFVQGNILTHRFKDVWEKEFKNFRHDLSDRNETCKNCDSCAFCHGGSFHSWDFDQNRPLICFKDILF